MKLFTGNIILYMIECDIRLTKINVKNKSKHLKSKRHNYYSNLVINNYCEQNVIKVEIKRVFYKYRSQHRKKFNEFEVEKGWKINDIIKQTFLGWVVNYDPELTRFDLF